VLKLLVFYRSAARVSNLAGRQGVSAAAFRNLKKHVRFRLTCFEPAICRRSTVSSAFVRSPLFSGFTSAMTLEMSLAAKEFPELPPRKSVEGARKLSTRTSCKLASSKHARARRFRAPVNTTAFHHRTVVWASAPVDGATCECLARTRLGPTGNGVLSTCAPFPRRLR
jgi:hypothetical protein